eukprot:12340-Hanusia_phi.AAC.2
MRMIVDGKSADGEKARGGQGWNGKRIQGGWGRGEGMERGENLTIPPGQLPLDAENEDDRMVTTLIPQTHGDRVACLRPEVGCRSPLSLLLSSCPILLSRTRIHSLPPVLFSRSERQQCPGAELSLVGGVGQPGAAGVSRAGEQGRCWQQEEAEEKEEQRGRGGERQGDGK